MLLMFYDLYVSSKIRQLNEFFGNFKQHSVLLTDRKAKELFSHLEKFTLHHLVESSYCTKSTALWG